jgi:hypothetical protein
MSLIFSNQNQNLSDLKRINDSMSEKIKQNRKQKNLFQNNNIASNITSGINTEKRMEYKNNLEEFNAMNNNINVNASSSFGRNASQSSLSIDLNRFKINPNNFNNSKQKEKIKNQNNNNKNNYNDNFETFNPVKDSKVSMNNSNENIDSNNINNENNKKSQENNGLNSLLKNFKPYDIKNFMGGSNPQPKKFQKNKSTFVYNISPSTSNLQMILYNKKMEDLSRKNNPDFIFKEFHQKESRRMLVEYLKIYRNNNIPLTTFMKKENINPLVILKEKNEEQISENKNGFNNDDIYNSNYFSKNEINESNSKSFMSKNKELTENNSKAKLKNINSFKILSAFLNDVNDESQEKELLIFLSIPRILRLISSGEKLSYIFCSSPTNISCSYGIETYIFKWNDCKNYNLIGYFDLINVENCYINNENKKRFDIYVNPSKKIKNEINKINEEQLYSIETNDEDITQNYVQAINFVSQLVKYRVYLKQKKEGKLKNYNFN